MTHEREYGGSATLEDGSRVVLSADEAKEIWDQIETAKKQRAIDMPTTQSALIAKSNANQRLHDLGWRSGTFKMPRENLAIVENGSTGIFSAFVFGEYLHFSGCVGKVGDDKFMWKAVQDLTPDELETMEACDKKSAMLIERELASFAAMENEP